MSPHNSDVFKRNLAMEVHIKLDVYFISTLLCVSLHQLHNIGTLTFKQLNYIQSVHQ